MAFDLSDPGQRQSLLQKAFDNGLLILPAGSCSVRLRPALNVSEADIDEAVAIIGKSMAQVM